MMTKFVLLSTAAILTATANAQWTTTVIHPGGTFSAAYGAGNGIALGNWGTSLSRAGYWTNSGTTFTELHQNTFTSSITYAGDLNMQVGTVQNPGSGHAARWFGTAGSFEDMNPSRFGYSEATTMFGNKMAGSGQQGPMPGIRALLWNGGGAEDYVDLNPDGSESASVRAMDATTQVGGAQLTPVDNYHAGFWMGSAASFVDLHPAGYLSSYGRAVSNGRQGGTAQHIDGQDHAFLWSSTPESGIDLHPDGHLVSEVNGMSSNYQTGSTYFENGNFINHAALWSGSKASYVDLHAFLPAEFTHSTATSIVEYQDRIEIYGYALRNSLGDDRMAVMWSQPVPEPATMLGLAIGGLSLLRRKRKSC
ncbi:MAG TPA: PEP-CTERM sorting domain-containing protein [Fimbriimonas sp.]|nr:PEP-CTERM sorting domain-containing protein [Fimbriimonas sp.]